MKHNQKLEVPEHGSAGMTGLVHYSKYPVLVDNQAFTTSSEFTCAIRGPGFYCHFRAQDRGALILLRLQQSH